MPSRPPVAKPDKKKSPAVTKKAAVKKAGGTIGKTGVKKTKKKESGGAVDWFNGKRVELLVTVVVTTLVVIALFGAAGWIIDQKLGTKPIFLIVLIVISFPVTQLILYKRIQKIIRNK